MPKVKKFNQDEVLEKAMNLFWKQGYAATSIQDLVDHLGINRGSLYDTFGGKEALFKKSFQLYIDNNIKGITAFLNAEKDVKKGFQKLFQQATKEAVLDIDKKGCFVVNTTTELIPNEDFIEEILEKNRNNFEQIFFEFLKRGADKGEIQTKHDLKTVARLFYTLYNGLRVVSKVKPNKKNLNESIHVALSLLD